MILRLPVRGRGLQELQELRSGGRARGGGRGARARTGEASATCRARATVHAEKDALRVGKRAIERLGARSCLTPRNGPRGRSGGRRETSPARAGGLGTGRARTSFSAKSSMSMITSRLCAVRPAILDAASPSTMIVGDSTVEDLGVHSLEEVREDLAPALALFGRAADANTALLATQEAIFSVCEEKRTATCALQCEGTLGAARRHVEEAGMWETSPVSRAVGPNLES